MANVPPNPFDQAGVDKYLADKTTAEVAKSRRAEQAPAPAVLDNVAELETDTNPAVEATIMLNYWAERGPEAYAEAVGTIAAALEATAAELGEAAERVPEHLDSDAVLVSARLGKSIEAAGKKMYGASRAALWQLVDKTNGKHKTPGGESFTFKAGARSTTRVDSKLLKADFPDVYEKVAVTTTKDADAPGTLLL